MSEFSTKYPILYSFRRCPYAIRTRWTLAFCKITFIHREILLKDKPQSMLNLSPKGTVPVFILQNGTVLHESLDIMNWAVKQSETSSELCPKAELTSIESLLSQNDSVFKPWLDKFKYASRFPEQDQNHYKQGACLILAQWEEKIKAKGFLVSENFTLADVALFPFVRQFAFVEQQWFFDEEPFPYLKAWLLNFLEAPLFNTIMKKMPLWQENGEDILFSTLDEREIIALASQKSKL